MKRYDMSADRIVGDGCNVTVYEREDKSRYALDRRGAGTEWDDTEPIFGKARFDSRHLSTGRWEGSRSLQSAPPPGDPPRARRRSGSRLA
jgi:hypothetical protein